MSAIAHYCIQLELTHLCATLDDVAEVFPSDLVVFGAVSFDVSDSTKLSQRLVNSGA